MDSVITDPVRAAVAPPQKANIIGRVERLRERMREEGLDAYLIPSADPHNNEYLPECWKRRQFISGFTGSAGDVVITMKEGGLWTDGRYFLQAEDQLRGTGLDLFKLDEPGVPALKDWVANTLASGGVLGVDPRLLTVLRASELDKALQERDATLRYLDHNLVDEVWDDQPVRGQAPLEMMPTGIAGRSIGEKLRDVREKMEQKHCRAHLLSTLDAIAWLFNLRGSDIAFNRIFVAYAAVTLDRAHLFIDPARVTDALRHHLGDAVEIRPYEDIEAFTRALTTDQGPVWIDPKGASQWLRAQIGGAIKVFEATSPAIDLKAVKNEIELKGFRDCHRADGVAMVRFLKWLEEAVADGGVTEISASEKLAAFRAEQDGFIGLSFPTIAGYAGHGAIIHYEATPESDAELRPEGIFLLDSGGHYQTGTTDITRTLALGEPDAEQRDAFTRVLKGLIGVTTLKFPKGSSGRQLDLPARKALWDSGRNYKHGTGHGVGHSLNVHEGPIGLSPRDQGLPLEPGHVISNEPGYYRTGEYGMRVENLMIVRVDEDLSARAPETFLGFETITLCPIDLKLVERALLTGEEAAWLNDYHRTVYDLLAPALDEEHRCWLQKQTRNI